MNLIFICVFNQDKYVDMLFLLLESINIYGNLDNTHILIYTSTLFMNRIKESHMYNDKIIFEINDGYNNIDKARKARLDLFDLQSISNYNKILYLDTDTIVKNDISKVFDVCNEDILYACTSILLFNNSEKIRELFNKINEDTVNKPYNFTRYYQPYIVYNALKYHLYNNRILKSFVVNNDTNIHSDKVIHHFPGVPYQNKIEVMTTFLNKCKHVPEFCIEIKYI